MAIEAKPGRTTPLSGVRRFSVGPDCSVYALKEVSGDAFVARLDRTGAVEWSTYLADIGLEPVTALSTDNAGSVLVAGTVGMTPDVLLAKYTSDGRLLWKKTLGGDTWDTPVVPDETPVTAGAYVSPVRARACGPLSWSPAVSWDPADLQIARLRAGTFEPEFSALPPANAALASIRSMSRRMGV